MAEKLAALEDLKQAFAVNFDQISGQVATLQNIANEISLANTKSAGSDDIGKQYHSTVDAPTQALSDLLTAVLNAVTTVGQQGQIAATIFTSADQDALDQVSGS